MEEKYAIKLLDETFSNDFNINRFSIFIKELFKKIEIKKRDCTQYIAKEYEDYISDLIKLGEYEDNKKMSIEILVVKLKKASSRDRARTMQRNFIANWLGKYDKYAALVAFYEEDEDWRFSFVKMEYNLLKDEVGKVKIVEELTPAKRYSFLVGKNEPNHTCKSRFLEMIEKEDISPNLDEIEEMFSIEKVTEEFFLEYKNLYDELKKSLDKLIIKNQQIKSDFNEKNISTVDFAKKLLGQIVFIYFLQKKGWLGVQKDEKGKFNEWGSGPKDFLKKLFNKEIVAYNNFFNDILEPLFYEALATPRDEDYYSRFDCKIPFLNGGLFEPINYYNWRENKISLENSIFDKILNTFNRFNFTVKEDEPLEREVAVDPEMLGKVFENLLETEERKSTGRFYTPREIVHYMCKQSLINYLENNINIPKEDIEKFIHLGDFTLEINIKEQEQIRKYGKTFINEKYSLSNSIKENYLKIDQLLKDIKVVDPAAGSGSFPVGMMNNIVKARSVLTIFFKDEQKERTNYNLKRETIENSFYGVDTDSSAVDIAKLRFWLSLIVDETDMRNIKPLPNLDYKIICGNSLLEEFEGIKLFDERLLGEVKKDYSSKIKQIDNEIDKLCKEKGYIATGKSKSDKSIKDINREIKKLEMKKQKILSEPKKNERDLTLGEVTETKIKESQKKLSELKMLQKQFINEQNINKKKQLREDIDKIEWELVEETLKEQGNEKAMKKLQIYKKNKTKPFFLWKLYFAEIFQRENSGFDIVIGNPPYVSAVQHSKKNSEEREIYRKLYPELKGAFDLYVVFLLRTLNLINKRGSYSWIIPNKFLISEYSEEVLKKMKMNGLYATIDVSKYNVFHDIGIYPIIILGNTQKNSYNNYEIDEIDDLRNNKIKICKTVFEFKTFNDFGIKIASGTTGFQASQIKSLIADKEDRSSNSIPFAVSGSIDPYIVDTKSVRYMGRTYNYPYIKNDSNIIAKSKWNFWFNEKIVIAGMTKRIEGTYVKSPLALGVGCYAIYEWGNFDPRFLLSLLNSSFLTYYLNVKFKDKHLAGGYLAINKSTIEKLPLVDVNKSEQKPFIELVDRILSITKDDDYLVNTEKQAKVNKFEREIDQLVYKLFKLTDEEIDIIENFKK